MCFETISASNKLLAKLVDFHFDWEKHETVHHQFLQNVLIYFEANLLQKSQISERFELHQLRLCLVLGILFGKTLLWCECN